MLFYRNFGTFELLCFSTSLRFLLESRAVVLHAFTHSTRETDTGESLSSKAASGLHSEFQDNQGYTEKPCLKKEKPITTTKQREIKRKENMMCKTQGNTVQPLHIKFAIWNNVDGSEGIVQK